MTWYKTGTVAVTQGSNAVIGTGTSFIANSRVGDGFRGPDGEWYEVTNIASDTALSIAPNYQGSAVTSGGYSLAPMQGYVKDSADALRAATQMIASGVADMQEQVATATEAAESAALSKAGATEQAGIATAAASLSTDNRDAAQLAAQQSASSAQASDVAADRSETARDSIIQSEQAAAASAAAAADSAEQAEEATQGKAASGNNNDITSLRALTADGFDRIRQGLAPFVGSTASAAGVKGLVPAPAAGDQGKFLSGSGAYVAPPSMSWGQIAGTLSSQADLKAALDAKLSISDAIFSKQYPANNGALSWVSSPGTAGLLTIAHGLGVAPKFKVMYAKCITADAGFAVGDIVEVTCPSGDYIGSAPGYGFAYYNPDATNMYIRFPSSANWNSLIKTTGGHTSYNIANWQYAFRAWS